MGMRVKRDFIGKIAKDLGYKNIHVEKVVEGMFGTIIDHLSTLEVGEFKHFMGFGRFKITSSPNIKNGIANYGREAFECDSHKVVRFKSDPILNRKLNDPLYCRDNIT